MRDSTGGKSYIVINALHEGYDIVTCYVANTLHLIHLKAEDECSYADVSCR